MIKCDEFITLSDTLLTKFTNTIATNVTSSASIYFHCKKVKDCYILHTILLVIVLLLIITIVCYHCVNERRINTIII